MAPQKKPNRDNYENDDFVFMPVQYLADVEKMVETLTMRAMADGNSGDFSTAFDDLELAIWFSRSLGKGCLEAVLLNNVGLLHIMNGSWDKAMLTFERSMNLALSSCPAHTNFLNTLKKNIASLFQGHVK